MFFRLDEIAKEHPGDFDIQLSVSELKQRVVARGTFLKQLAQNPEGRESPRTLTLPSQPSPFAAGSDREPLAATGRLTQPPVPAAFQAPPEAPARSDTDPSTITMSAITMSGVGGPPPARPAPPNKPDAEDQKWKQALAL